MINIAICDDAMVFTTRLEELIMDFSKAYSFDICIYFDGDTLLEAVKQGICFDIISIFMETVTPLQTLLPNGIDTSDLMNMETVDDVIGLIQRLDWNVAEIPKDTEKENSDILLDNLKQYIRDNCLRCESSIQETAEHFHMLLPNLSQFFKEKTGGNILATSGDKEFEGLIPAILAVNGDSLKTKREEMKSVMKAWYSARDAYDIDPEKFAEAVAGGAEVTAEEFLELMKGCDVRTMEDNAEAFAAGDTYVSLPYCAKMLAGFLQYNGLIDSMPDNFNDLFDSSLFEEVYEEMK